MPAKWVLLIDDEPDNLECVQAFLQPEFEVVTACGGARGIDCLLERSFDAVVLDLTMPTVDGFEVMRAIRQVLPELPVLLASALPNLEGIAADVGAQDCVSKPCKFSELRLKLQRLTDAHAPQDSS